MAVNILLFKMSVSTTQAYQKGCRCRSNFLSPLNPGISQVTWWKSSSGLSEAAWKLVDFWKQVLSNEERLNNRWSSLDYKKNALLFAVVVYRVPERIDFSSGAKSSVLTHACNKKHRRKATGWWDSWNEFEFTTQNIWWYGEKWEHNVAYYLVGKSTMDRVGENGRIS